MSKTLTVLVAYLAGLVSGVVLVFDDPHAAPDWDLHPLDKRNNG